MAQKAKNIVSEALWQCKSVIIVLLVLSGLTNLLMLMLPLYSMNVLDRVISSGSIETLVMLTLLAGLLFLAFALITAAKSSMMVKLSEWLDEKLSLSLLSLSVSASLIKGSTSGSQNMRDLSVIRTFVTGSSMTSFLDLPWALLYIAVIFLINPAIGLVTVMGGVILFILAIFNEYATKAPLQEANEVSIKAMAHAEISTRNAEAVEAMGMTSAITNEWRKISNEITRLQSVASNRAGVIVAITRFIRLFIQVLIVGAGAALSLTNHISPGGIIACSILASKALSPFEASITLWKSIVDVRKSYERLSKALETTPKREKGINLPKPTGLLQVERILFAAPSNPTKPILKGITFELKAGESLAILGPSAAGKSTLAKLIVGVWKPQAGVARLDSADVYSWNRDDFGKHVGYLPQDVELFRGTVKENIARMRDDATDDAIVKAAQIAGVHDMILHLPKGYETDIGIGGALLSGGQRQRVGLARAFYGDPKLLVLDEPNANLDIEGENSLMQALSNAKQQNITTIIVTHRQAILAAMDKMMVMKEGTIESFGPTKDVLKKYTEAAQKMKALSPGEREVAAAEGARPPANPIHNVESVKQA